MEITSVGRERVCPSSTLDRKKAVHAASLIAYATTSRRLSDLRRISKTRGVGRPTSMAKEPTVMYEKLFDPERNLGFWTLILRRIEIQDSRAARRKKVGNQTFLEH